LPMRSVFPVCLALTRPQLYRGWNLCAYSAHIDTQSSYSSVHLRDMRETREIVHMFASAREDQAFAEESPIRQRPVKAKDENSHRANVEYPIARPLRFFLVVDRLALRVRKPESRSDCRGALAKKKKKKNTDRRHPFAVVCQWHYHSDTQVMRATRQGRGAHR